MSFAIECNSDVRRTIEGLDLLLQEAVWDELERLADAGRLLPGRPLPPTVIADARVVNADGENYAFIVADYDEPRRTLVVVRVGPFLRPRR